MSNRWTSTVLGVGCLLALRWVSPGASAEVCQSGFLRGPVFPVESNAGTSALGDLDRDGDLDLTTGHSLLLGKGDGTFEAPVPLSLGGSYIIFDVAPADLDGDGWLDLALAPLGFTREDGAVILLYGRDASEPGRPPFEDPVVVPLAVGIWHLAVGDLSGDGLPDIVAVGMGPDGDPGSLPLAINEGGRSFRSTAVGPAGVPGHMLAIGDFDGDGARDIAFGAGSEVHLLFGAGGGTFGPARSSTLVAGVEPLQGHRFRSADLDGDGRSDLLAVAGGYVVVYPGSAIDATRGLPRQPALALPVRGTGRFIEVAEVNGDGLLDIVAQSAYDGGAEVRVFFGAGPDGVLPMSYVKGDALPRTDISDGTVLAVGDVDGDATQDVVLTSESTFRGQVFRNDGRCVDRQAGDANADGTLDLSDPVAILSHLFLGGGLACPGAAEVSGDATLDISDPIYLLGYLFLGGPPPAGPSPRPCG